MKRPSAKVINDKQEKMISMIIVGEGITDIANSLNIARQTVYDWLKRDDIKAELDQRRRDLASQGNQLILKDIDTYIEQIKKLAKDPSDKRVCLAANQYLLNRIYGNPTSIVESTEVENEGVNEFELEAELKRFKLIKK